ncbi:glycosyltransferase family 2 protein [Heyndrickxia camelliae]|uniref:Glycosyltransferase n=1 Tax=Heyndrickxia camelliae TaxID=1707093 RepID=A0A2N3LDB9_9BACI|nr:glycosyltransferase [Heyndrickxia camelliae]PKR82660.1 glycosyltransferase [Heyndrickxia camelliae]
MNNKYKLSVVVLVYNTECYLRECLDSLVNQTLKDIEIIIVNDSSPDNSHLIIEEYDSLYENIKVINQKNSGGAIAGNNGLRQSSGEYVTIMDSDDIVPLNAYEKLYNEAKSTDAEIVIGKPNILLNGVQREIIYKRERDVWKENRIVSDLLEFPEIFYDGFYWNKIYKRELLFKHDCFMPPGMLYADRPMVHKAFLYAKKISIITDVVYLWRKRDEDTKAKSITQLKFDLNNLKDRITSLNYQIDYFKKYGNMTLTNEFLKTNIDRLFFPINGIIGDKVFRSVYFKELKRIFSQISNIYDNDLGITKNIYIYMILNNLKSELINYLTNEPKGKIIGENGNFYWTLPYFRDKTVKIPDHLFRINTLFEAIIKIGSISCENNHLKIKDLNIPAAFTIHSVKLEMQSRFNIDDRMIFNLNMKSFNCFSYELELSHFDSTNIYDMYLIFNYDNNKEAKFRITKNMCKYAGNGKIAQNQKYRLYFTDKNSLSFQILNFDIISIECDTKKISIQTSDHTNKDLYFYFKDRKYKEKIYMKKDKDTGAYELQWSHFIERYRYYDLYFNCFNNEFRVSTNVINNFNDITLVKDKTLIELYGTKNHNLSLKTSTQFVQFLSKVKKIAK